MQNNFKKIKNTTITVTQNIGTKVEMLGDSVSENLSMQKAYNHFIKSVDIEKMITALNSIKVIDNNTRSNIDLLINVLKTLKTGEDGNGMKQAIALLRNINIDDVINSLNPFINLIPYGNQLIFILKLVMKLRIGEK